MKNILYYTLYLIIFISCCNNKGKETPVIKQINQRKYEAKIKSGKIVKGNLTNEFIDYNIPFSQTECFTGLDSNSELYFDKNGEIVVYYSFKNNTISNKTIWIRKNGNIIKKTSYSKNYYDDLYKIDYQHEFKYDSNNQIIEDFATYCWPGRPCYNNKMIYIYKNDTVIESGYDHDENLDFTIINIYKHNNIIKEIYTSYNEKTEKYYNYEKNKLVKIIELDLINNTNNQYLYNDKNLISEANIDSVNYKYYYNKHNDIVSIIANGIEKYSFSYKYDNNNNWTEQIIYKYSNPIQIITRELKYWSEIDDPKVIPLEEELIITSNSIDRNIVNLQEDENTKIDLAYIDSVLRYSISTSDKQALASIIRFPLYRPYPLRTINNKKEFIAYYDTIIEQEFIDAINNNKYFWKSYNHHRGDYYLNYNCDKEWHIKDNFYHNSKTEICEIPLSKKEKQLRRKYIQQERQTLQGYEYYKLENCIELADGTVYRILTTRANGPINCYKFCKNLNESHDYLQGIPLIALEYAPNQYDNVKNIHYGCLYSDGAAYHQGYIFDNKNFVQWEQRKFYLLSEGSEIFSMNNYEKHEPCKRTCWRDYKK